MNEIGIVVMIVIMNTIIIDTKCMRGEWVIGVDGERGG